MKKKTLFKLKDLKAQLNEKQLKEVEHIIYMAKETKEFQQFQLGDYGKWVVVFPSGKMMFKPEQEQEKK